MYIQPLGCRALPGKVLQLIFIYIWLSGAVFKPTNYRMLGTYIYIDSYGISMSYKQLKLRWDFIKDISTNKMMFFGALCLFIHNIIVAQNSWFWWLKKALMNCNEWFVYVKSFLQPQKVDCYKPGIRETGTMVRWTKIKHLWVQWNRFSHFNCM